MDINGFWQAGHRAPQRFISRAFQRVKVGEKVYFYNFMLMLILCLLILKKNHTLLKHAQKIRFFLIYKSYSTFRLKLFMFLSII